MTDRRRVNPKTQETTNIASNKPLRYNPVVGSWYERMKKWDRKALFDTTVETHIVERTVSGSAILCEHIEDKIVVHTNLMI